MNYFSHTKKECKRNIKLLRGVMKYQSKYYYTEHCVKCNHKISDFKKYYSGGVCPYCGKGNNSTIVNTYKKVFRYVSNYPLWIFWKREIEYK